MDSSYNGPPPATASFLQQAFLPQLIEAANSYSKASKIKNAYLLGGYTVRPRTCPPTSTLPAQPASSKDDLSFPELIKDSGSNSQEGLYAMVESNSIDWDVVASLGRKDQKKLMDLLDQIVSRKANLNQPASTCRIWLARLHRLTHHIPPTLFIKQVKKLDEYPIGGGGFGDIYQGTYENNLVAIKASRFYREVDVQEMETALRRFYAEAFVWKHLEHPNVLPLFGICNTVVRGQLSIISPFMKNGNIVDYVMSNPDCDRLELLRQTALGLDYLHSISPSIIHGDIKGTNILVDDFGCARICDLGLTHFSGLLSVAFSQSLNDTARWSAPEMFDGNEVKPTTSSDVYGLGMTMLEVLSGEVPYVEVKSEFKVMKLVINGKYPTRPSLGLPIDLDDAVWEILEECWIYQANRRPSAAWVALSLDKCLSYPSEEVSYIEVFPDLLDPE